LVAGDQHPPGSAGAARRAGYLRRNSAPAATGFDVTRRAGCGIQLRVAKLNAVQIKSALGALPGWKRSGAAIKRTFAFADFPAAIRFVNLVARRAEKARHHPDVDIRWDKVTLTLTTHSEGGLTEKDFNLAAQFDRL
jgi:4a-hydroxytetrahydrobiopterin dehydratase